MANQTEGQSVEQNEQLPVRNLKTNQEETIQAMMQICGPRWAKQQALIQQEGTESGYYPNSLQNALDRLAEGKNKSVIEGLEDHSLRWIVDGEGNVKFSVSRGGERFTDIAKEFGFEMLP